MKPSQTNAIRRYYDRKRRRRLKENPKLEYRRKLLAQIYDFDDVKELALKRDKLQAKIELLLEECRGSVKKYEDERQVLVVNYYSKLFDYKDTDENV